MAGAELRAIAGWIGRRLRWRWALLMPVMTLAAAFEALGALAVFGLLRLVVEPQRVRITPGVSQIWLAWPTDDPQAILGFLVASVAVLYLLRAAFLGWAEWFKESTVSRSAAEAADRLFARYLAADVLFHLRRRTAAPIQEVSRSTSAAFQLVAASALNIFAEAATIVALVVVLAITAPASTLLAVAVILAVVALPIVGARRHWLASGAALKRLEEQQLHLLHQSLGAIAEVKVSGREAFFEGRLRALRRDLAIVETRRKTLATGLRVGVELALMLMLLLVVWLIVRRGVSGAESASLLALFAYTGFRVIPSANRIMLNAGYYREGLAFINDALADFRRLSPLARARGGDAPLTFQQSLVCEDVSFAYEPGQPPAIDRLHLRLAAGESLGIVGATGAGKSTLLALLLGLLQPTSGRILIDGVDLASRERSWQRHIGYVPQDPALLDDTLRRNIAFGVPDNVIDESKLARACAHAQLEEVVRGLPEGLDTVIGEGGARLSGGQRQRVAIARALYGDPDVLVFDEATAALDNQTEREVTRALSALHGTRTLIVVAHRLSTVQGCDRLVFLQHGRVAATGTYRELEQNAAFRAMAAL